MQRVTGHRGYLAAVPRRPLGVRSVAAAFGFALALSSARADDAPSAPPPAPADSPAAQPSQADASPAPPQPEPAPAPSLTDKLTEQVADLTRLSLSTGYTTLPPLPPLAIAGWASTGGSLRVTDGLSLTGSRSELTLGSGPSGRQTTEIYDVAASVDAISIAEVSLSLVGGVRVATEGPVDASATRMAITPVLGPAIRWKRGPSELRALVLGDATGANEDFVEFRIEQVWNLTADATLSLGYQHQRSMFQDVPVRTAERRDAFSIELRLNF